MNQTESLGQGRGRAERATDTSLDLFCEQLSHLNKEKKNEVAQSCLTLCDPMDCSLPGSSVHGIFQARVLRWVAISFSRGSSWSRGWTQVSRSVGSHFIIWATREVLNNPSFKRECLTAEQLNAVFLFVCLGIYLFILLKIIYFNWRLITLQYCIGFAIHQHESAMGVQ